MKGFLTVLALTIIFSGAARAQETATTEKKALTDKAFALYQQGKLDAAIESAAKVVRLEEKANQTDTSSHVNAIINLARMKRDNFTVLRNKSRDKNYDVRARIGIAEKASENARESEELYRKAIMLNESGGRGRTAQTADVKSELAWLTSNFLPPTDKPSIAYSRSRIDEAERLFAESLALNEESRGKDAPETLSLVLGLGNFYFKYDNYEKALPFYERYIPAVEMKSGKNHPGLVDALRPYARILSATTQDSDFAAAVKRIEEITGQKENSPLDELSLHLRSKDSVAFHAKNFEDLRSRNAAYRPQVTNTRVKVTV
ncbi:MAG: tetratricopeptide repeat protein, partial [Acidobacteriota bacterium]|nr:tetratricopeptide repeat protein [Acidobacteriota bacterium]